MRISAENATSTRSAGSDKIKMSKKIVLLLAALALIITAAFLYFDRGVAYMLGKKYDLDIAYKKCSKNFSGQLNFEDLSITSKSTGLCFISKNAIIRPTFSGKRTLLDFDLHDLYFTKRTAAGPEKYDTLTALVSSPFNSKWKYKEVRGQIEPGKKSVKINSLDAISDQLRLSMKGYYFYNGTIDSDIIIYFAAKLTEKVPPEFAKVILGDEKGGWKSLSVHLTGDPNKPSIQVSSKLFRLSIKSVSR